MVDKDYTHVTLLLDESGSMGALRNSTIESINSFVKQQKDCDRKCTISLNTFNTELNNRIDYLDIKYWKDLELEDYTPGGGTALFDAMGQTIESLGIKLKSLPEHERPGNVICVIITDGYENSSRKFKSQSIKDKVVHQTNKYAWDFVYLGANQDAFLVGKDLGFADKYCNSYNTSQDGIKNLYGQMSDGILRARRANDMEMKTCALQNAVTNVGQSN